MPYTVQGKNIMLNALGVTHVSLHTAAPTDAGLNEVTGGTYARQPIVYATSTIGILDDNGLTSPINVPAGTTVAYIGYWNALTAGTFLGYDAITNEVYTNTGTLKVTDSKLDLNL